MTVVGFAGGGGSSIGISKAIGKPVDYAVNHWMPAIWMHATNHPETVHYQEDIWATGTEQVTGRGPVGLAWLSPDCTHFSRAKGKAPIRTPKQRASRAMGWVAVHWARRMRPRIIMLENVVEWLDWGPVDEHGYPIAERKGETFEKWTAKMREEGYDKMEWRRLRACDYGTPTIRERMYLIARRDGERVQWPEPTHGPGRTYPYRTAAECIDWHEPSHSIFLSREEARRLGCRRPLAETTMKRIARGIWKYVINHPEPFIVPLTHAGERRVHGLDEPFPTITGAHRGELAIAEPRIEQANAFLMRHFGGSTGQEVTRPCPTITAGGGGKTALVNAHVSYQYSSNTGGGGGDLRLPMRTITAKGQHAALVETMLERYRPPEHEREAYPGSDKGYRIVDVSMRMLTARELFRAQGFPESYEIRPEFNGKPMSKTDQVLLCGNAVCPQVARALVQANI